MPRANRYFISGHVWHITHRCHKKEFLLKFAWDRKTWIHWLFESRKRYGIEVLNYAVTSNHIHMLVYGSVNREIIPRSLQLTAGRTAQSFNQRKMRKGAFWEDRYHATAVDTDEHFIRCMTYIDLNMVRAGVVQHPSEWPHGGYQEIIDPPSRYRIISRGRLAQLLRTDEDALADTYRRYVDNAGSLRKMREDAWTGAIAVGQVQFIEKIKEQLGAAVSKKREMKRDLPDVACALQERLSPYNAYFDGKMDGLSLENRLIWNIFD
jgi:putative transposase